MSAGLDGSLVLVAGGAGRVGKLVVEELLREHPGCKVRASVRDVEKAKEVLSEALATSNGRLEVTKAKKKDNIIYHRKKQNDVFPQVFVPLHARYT